MLLPEYLYFQFLKSKGSVEWIESLFEYFIMRFYFSILNKCITLKIHYQDEY